MTGVVDAEVVIREGSEAMARQAQWLVIVRRDQPGLYRHLLEEFEGIGLIEVIFDRRRGEDVVAPWLTTAFDERRRVASSKELVRWRSVGYQVVPRHGNPGVGPPPV